MQVTVVPDNSVLLEGTITEVREFLSGREAETLATLFPYEVVVLNKQTFLNLQGRK